ncbi:MAG: hypothetical protein ACHQVS_05540 [Candidatus Babeliales bacterium]
MIFLPWMMCIYFTQKKILFKTVKRISSLYFDERELDTMFGMRYGMFTTDLGNANDDFAVDSQIHHNDMIVVGGYGLEWLKL